MRFVHLLSGVALALAAPALAQTVGRTPLPEPAATATPTPDATPADAQPGTPAGTVTAPVPVAPAVGVKVFDPSGTEVGTIKALDTQYATIATAKGDVKLPAAGVGPGVNGAAVGLTAAQIDAAVAQAAPAAGTNETKTTTTTRKKAGR